MASPSSNQKPNFTLTASSPLARHCTIIDGASLVEVSPRSIVSLSPFANSAEVFNTAISKLCNSAQPNATKACEINGKNSCVLLPSSHSQWFLCFDDEVLDPVASASDLIGKMVSNQVAMTDQSDAWVTLELTGPLIHLTLERICPIDCSTQAMPIGTTARTMIEHLGTIISRRPNDENGNPCFWLMSARSSAASFLHVITGSPPFTPR
ncbi:MAG: sarcosine oxidase subunit gamma [Candidatus Puniceispirillaceae bacterium]